MDLQRQILFDKLRNKNAFWSFSDFVEPSDDLLIEKVLLMLDIDDINTLFRIFGKEYVRKIWEAKILRQEPYYHGLNRFFAWYYFDIEDPDKYLVNQKNYFHV